MAVNQLILLSLFLTRNKSTQPGLKVLAWYRTTFPFTYYPPVTFLLPVPLFPPSSSLRLWDRSCFTELQMKFYHTCTAVVTKHSCFLSSGKNSRQLHKTAMKYLHLDKSLWINWLSSRKHPLNPAKGAGWLMTKQEVALTVASCQRAGQDVRDILHMCPNRLAVPER